MKYRWLLVFGVCLSLFAGSPAFAQEPDAFTKAMQAGPLFAVLVAFLGGLGTCLTPCVYPMIAITVSVFGARQTKSRAEAMLLSTCFVLGIVALFTPMLMFAGLTGSLFGGLLQNRWVIVGVVAIFTASALSMFGAFDMTLPQGVMQRLSAVGGAGYRGAFLLGLVSGIIAAPCTGPVLTGVLVWIGTSKNVALGAVFGTAFSVGLGIPFWIVGTFAASLPKGGKWMLGVKSFFGIVMLVVALYFLKIAFPTIGRFAEPNYRFFGAALLLILFGLAAGAVHVSWDDGGVWTKTRKAFGIVMTVLGSFAVWAWVEAKPVSASGPLALTWEKVESVAVAKAQDEKRPLLVDFTADWCGACKKLERETLSDARVVNEAKNFIALRIDATNDDDPTVEAIKNKYKVVGLPTVLVFDSAGKERKRFNDFVPAETFLTALVGID